jgi:hypothetical protein
MNPQKESQTMRTRFRNDVEVLSHVHQTKEVQLELAELITAILLRGAVLGHAQTLIDTIQNEISLASDEEILEKVSGAV